MDCDWGLTYRRYPRRCRFIALGQDHPSSGGVFFATAFPRSRKRNITTDYTNLLRIRQNGNDPGAFLQRGGLPEKEPVIQRRWDEMEIYLKTVEKSAGRSSSNARSYHGMQATRPYHLDAAPFPEEDAERVQPGPLTEGHLVIEQARLPTNDTRSEKTGDEGVAEAGE